MNSVVIRQCAISEVLDAPNIDALLDEYASESVTDGLPSYAAKAEMYKQLETIGALYTVGAFIDDELVGFVTVLSAVMAHYSACVSNTESFFVAKEHRKTGAGLKLLHEAERHAKERGSPGLLVSAPSGGTLAFVLTNIGYVESNRVFFRRFGNE